MSIFRTNGAEKGKTATHLTSLRSVECARLRTTEPLQTAGVQLRNRESACNPGEKRTTKRNARSLVTSETAKDELVALELNLERVDVVSLVGHLDGVRPAMREGEKAGMKEGERSARRCGASLGGSGGRRGSAENVDGSSTSLVGEDASRLRYCRASVGRTVRLPPLPSNRLTVACKR
jgi:hypothetical protein